MEGDTTISSLKQINSEFDKIYADNKNLATVLTNHTKILKMILDSSSINHEELLKDRMEEHDLAMDMSRKLNFSIQSNFINDKLIKGLFTYILEIPIIEQEEGQIQRI